MQEHQINHGRLWPTKVHKADCTCGWSHEGTTEEVKRAKAAHEAMIIDQEAEAVGLGGTVG